MRGAKPFFGSGGGGGDCAARTKRRACFRLIRRHAQIRLANAGRRCRPSIWMRKTPMATAFLSIPILIAPRCFGARIRRESNFGLARARSYRRFYNDRIPNLDSRLCESAAGGESAAIEVLRAHLIQRGSLPDPAVFEEAAATVAYRLPGFSPSRGERWARVTVAVLGVSTDGESARRIRACWPVGDSGFAP